MAMKDWIIDHGQRTIKMWNKKTKLKKGYLKKKRRKNNSISFFAHI